MPRDVVWITLESVRQDHSSLGGYDRDTTPFLRSLGSRSDAATFTNCFSHDIWTRSSSASILTGLAPSAHRTWSQDDRLASDVPTVAEAFRDEGYRTACISPNPQLSDVTGLARGFDHFHYLGKENLIEEMGIPTMIRYLTGLRRYSAGYTTDTRKHSIGYLNEVLSKRHVRAASEEGTPLFLYVHLGDSHHPYYPPKPYQDAFTDGFEMGLDEALETSMDMSENLYEYMARDLPFADDEWEAIRAMYDAEILNVDQTTRRIVEYAESRLDDPIVVVTSDHGELLGESGLLAHMISVEDAVSHVPMVVSGVPGLSGTRDDIVQHADAMQTALTAAGVDFDLPVGYDLRKSDREFAVTQRSGARAQGKFGKLAESGPQFDASEYHSDDVTSVRTPEFRYTRSTDGDELFAIPDEETDVSEEHPDTRDELAETCESWLETYGLPYSEQRERAEFDDSMSDHLADLGYI
ncbi:sulfatase [Halopelagius longus]|uniref:Arylsulfatase n=1 Tax=Halopelagius longus TaxID=1236180 RepID=A0A1H1GN03_9EURY|nr:sulfatase-like hydrolase/transferase [Halopelagius longus]RDI69644.1 arylsulfatase [Halopelagius longus]SDR14604.1 Arylsulfatase A [Halopelagius longus]